MTVKQSFDEFMKHGGTYWAPRTVKYYERNMTYFFRFLEMEYHRPIDQIFLEDLPEDILVNYVLWLRSKNRYSDHPFNDFIKASGTIKSNTVRTYVRAVKAYFNYLYDAGHLRCRFTEGLKVPKPDDDQIIPLLQSEVDQIDAIFDPEIPNDLRNLCIVHLMLDAGLRSCEVIDLKPGDIIFASSTIVINRSKGDKSRVVIMGDRLADLLRAYLEMFKPTASLFRKTRSKENIDETVMKFIFVRIRKATGISRVHPHLLRHTFATSYIMGGGNLETLRILLGHFDYSVTRNYLHLATQYQIMKAPIYRLDPVFFEKGY